MQNSSEEFVCGGVAAVANILITFPINKLIFRQQLNGSRVRRALAELRSEGVWKTYRGVMPPLLQKGASLSLMFGTYDIFLRRIIEAFPLSGGQDTRLTAAQTAVAATLHNRQQQNGRSFSAPLRYQVTAGFLAGSVESILMPFERVQTLMQDRAYHLKLRNTAHAFREVGSHGFRECFRGFSAIFFRNGPSTALFFATRERVTELFTKWKLLADRQPVSEFLSGATCGAMNGTIFFPVNVAKSTMQARIGGPFEGFFKTLGRVYVERGRSIKLMYRGLSLTLLRTVLSWGIINMTYERCKKYFKHPKALQSSGSVH